MRRTPLDRAQCPAAPTTDLSGDWWTPIVSRELQLGVWQFGDEWMFDDAPGRRSN